MASRVDDALARACAIVAHKDSQPLRRALFRRKAERTPAIRAALATWRVLGTSSAAAAYVAAYAAASFVETRLPRSDAPIWAAWQYENEERALSSLARLDPALRLAPVTFGFGPRPVLEALGAAPRPVDRRAWRILSEYAGRGDFLVAARVASTVGYFQRLLPALERSSARAVWVSSDTNPYAVALTHAAECAGRRTCFVTHGHVAEDPPPLAFDLAIVDGAAVRDVYARAGPVRGRVVFRGAQGSARPMRTAPLRGEIGTVGVFLSILVDPAKLARAITELREALGPRRLLLRLHPNHQMRDPRWDRGVDLRGVEVSDATRPLEDDAARCELVAAGNSSAHLTALKLGVPSVYVGALDEVPDDYYGFVAARLLPSLSAEPRPTPGQIAAFYEDPGWARRFARFDAAYPDRQGECDREVRAALLELIAPR